MRIRERLGSNFVNLMLGYSIYLHLHTRIYAFKMLKCCIDVVLKLTSNICFSMLTNLLWKWIPQQETSLIVGHRGGVMLEMVQKTRKTYVRVRQEKRRLSFCWDGEGDIQAQIIFENLCSICSHLHHSIKSPVGFVKVWRNVHVLRQGHTFLHVYAPLRHNSERNISFLWLNKKP